MAVGVHAEKFNIVTNDQGRMQNCKFSVLHRKYPFLASLVQKSKFSVLSWNLLPWLIRIYRIQRWCSLFLFFRLRTQIPLLGRVSPKNQNCLSLELELSQNLLVLLRYIEFNGDVHSFCLARKDLFYGWNLEPRLILICRIRCWFSFYSFSDWKYPFLG